MNQQYDNTNSGVVFPNDKKTSPNSPNARGHVEVKCPCCEKVNKFWVSAWTKKAKATGKPFQSLALTPDDPNINNTPVANNPDDDYCDDIPF